MVDIRGTRDDLRVANESFSCAIVHAPSRADGREVGEHGTLRLIKPFEMSGPWVRLLTP